MRSIVVAGLALVFVSSPAIHTIRSEAYAPVALAAEFSGPPGSGKPNLTTAPDGGMILTWLEPAGKTRHALRFAVRRAGRWSAPGTIAERENFFVNWADFPSIVTTSTGGWVVHWLERTAERSYAYHIMLSASADGGRTWSAPVTAHEDRSPTEHGFVAMVPGPNGEVDLAWLDGRQMTAPETGNMSVRTGTLRADGTMGTEFLLDDRTCECCQVAMARATAGLVVAYRDRSDTEIRDIAIARRVDGKWLPPVFVARDGWEHRACPVNGPALSASGDKVTVVWYTGADNTPRVWSAVSADGGARWSSRIRIDDGDPIGRADTETLADGSTVVVWLEGDGQGAAWRARRIDADGTVGPSWVAAPSVRARQTGFPRLARRGADVILAYTDPAPDGGVRVVRMDPRRLPSQ